MAQSIGKRLQEARLTRGLSLEDVQHVTRIRLSQLVAMENDDLSVFASSAYARGFHTLYGKFLGVDLTGFLQSMESATLKSVRHHQYLRPSTDHVLRGRRGRSKQVQPLPGAGRLTLLGTAMVLVVGATAWFSHLYWRRNTLGRESAAAAASAAANLPLLAGTASPSATPEPVVDHPETILHAYPSPDGSHSVDVRSAPPPVLKALPVEDTGNRRTRPDSLESGDRVSPRQVPRPPPVTR